MGIQQTFPLVKFYLLYNFCSTNVVLKQIKEEENDFAVLLLEILLNTLVPYKCVAIITDDNYYGVLTDELFKKFDIYLSFFVVETNIFVEI